MSGDRPVQLRRGLWSRLVRQRVALVSAVLLLVMIVACIAAGWIAPFAVDWSNDTLSPSAPSREHWMGTDLLGRDIFSRILHGGAISLQIGIAVGVCSTLLGTAVGALAGWFRGLADGVLMRVTDLFLVIPQLVLLALGLRYLNGADRSPTRLSVIVVLVAVFWMPIARVVRAHVVGLADQEFVQAARAAGARSGRIIVRHLIPNCLGAILVSSTLAIAGAIITEASLAFLGFGLKIPATSWGTMISDAKPTAANPEQWYVMAFPGLAILLTVLATNFVGEGIRTVLGPDAR